MTPRHWTIHTRTCFCPWMISISNAKDSWGVVESALRGLIILRNTFSLLSMCIRFSRYTFKRYKDLILLLGDLDWTAWDSMFSCPTGSWEDNLGPVKRLGFLQDSTQLDSEYSTPGWCSVCRQIWGGLGHPRPRWATKERRPDSRSWLMLERPLFEDS